MLLVSEIRIAQGKNTARQKKNHKPSGPRTFNAASARQKFLEAKFKRDKISAWQNVLTAKIQHDGS